jgi:L-aspartate oxidase
LLSEIDDLQAEAGRGPVLAAARLTAAAALARRESRGAHHRLDFPGPADPPARTFITLTEAERP